jgi:hypothetical protein
MKGSWPQKGAKNAKKTSLFRHLFAPFCGHSSFRIVILRGPPGHVVIAKRFDALFPR